MNETTVHRENNNIVKYTRKRRKEEESKRIIHRSTRVEIERFLRSSGEVETSVEVELDP